MTPLTEAQMVDCRKAFTTFYGIHPPHSRTTPIDEAFLFAFAAGLAANQLPAESIPAGGAEPSKWQELMELCIRYRDASTIKESSDCVVLIDRFYHAHFQAQATQEPIFTTNSRSLADFARERPAPLADRAANEGWRELLHAAFHLIDESCTNAQTGAINVNNAIAHGNLQEISNALDHLGCNDHEDIDRIASAAPTPPAAPTGEAVPYKHPTDLLLALNKIAWMCQAIEGKYPSYAELQAIAMKAIERSTSE